MFLFFFLSFSFFFPFLSCLFPFITSCSALTRHSVLFAFSGIFTFFVDAYPLYAASALAGNAFARCLFAGESHLPVLPPRKPSADRPAAFPLFGVQMYDKLGYQWASSLLAFLAVAMLPFPFLFFKYGKYLRSRSRFAVS